MVKYRAFGPKHSCITDGKIYDLTPNGDGFKFLDDEGDERWTLLPVSSHCERFELVSDTPACVRTVTRQEIVPGTYDGVEVGSEVTGHPQREVMVRIAPDHGPMVCMDHTALTNAAAVLTALAGALRDGE